MYPIALAIWMRTLFGARADELARATCFIKRQRAFSGSQFLKALVFGWMKRHHVPLEHIAHRLGISRQALDQRWTPEATAFCRAILKEALDHVFQTQPQTFDLLKPFSSVFLDDATQLKLPDACADEDPGCGSGLEGLGKAGLKVLTRFEVLSGQLRHLSFHAARTADQKTITDAPELPKGCLHMADLGFTDFERLQGYGDKGIYFISRVPVQTRVFVPEHPKGLPLPQLLKQCRGNGEEAVDLEARLGNKGSVTGRLVALACPPEVVERRLRRLQKDAKRRNRPISERQRELCHWGVFVTNVPRSWLTSRQVWQVYRLRWQIELLFKRFKSEGGLKNNPSENPERVRCEWYLKLVGQIVRNWLMLLRGGPLENVNKVQVGRVIADWLERLCVVLRCQQELVQALEEMRAELKKVRQRTRRKKAPTVAEWLAAEVPPAA
jgi:hypothetical protein